jgi:hypothetical protein
MNGWVQCLTTSLLQQLQGVLDRVVVGTNTVSGAASGLVQQADYEKIHPLYEDTKSLICCEVANAFGQMWTTLTVSGGSPHSAAALV